MATIQTVNTVFGYAVDQASIARVQTTIKALKKEQRDLVNQFRALPQGDAALGGLAQKLDQNRVALRRATTEAEALRKKLKEVDETRVAPTIAVSPTSSAGIGGAIAPTNRGAAIARAGSELRMLPSTQIPGLGIGTDQIANVIRLTGALTTLAGGVGALLAVAAPLGVVVGALALLSADQTRKEELRAKAMEEAKEAAEAYIESLKEERRIREQVRDLIAAGNVQAVQARVRGVQAQITDADTEGVQLSTRIDAILQRIRADVEQEALQSLPASARPDAREQAIEAATFARAEQDPEFQTLTARAKELRTEIANLRAELGELTATALPGAEAIAVLEKGIEREQELRELSRKSVESLTAQLDELSEHYDDTADALKASDTALAEARAEGNDEAAAEILTYQELLRQRLLDIELTGNLVYDARELAEVRERETAAVKAQIAALDAQIARTTQQNQLRRTGTVQQVDERLAALNDENQAIRESLPALRARAATDEEAAKKVAEYESRLRVLNEEFGELSRLRPDVAARQFREESAKLLNELTADITRIGQQRDAQIAQFEAERTDKEAAAYAERDEAILEIQRKTQADEQAQAEKHQKALAKITAKGNAAIANAIANRDALAGFLALQAKKEQLAEEEDANKERLKEIQQRSDEEYRVTNERLADQLKAARDAADKSIRLERAKADAEINTRRAQYTAEFNALSQVVSGHASAWNSITSYAQQAVNFIQRLTGQAQTQFSQVVIPQTVQLPATTSQEQAAAQFNAYMRSQGIPGFASGVRNLAHDTLALVGEKGPELVSLRRGSSVYNNSETRQLMGAATININLDGKTIRATARAEAVAFVDYALRQSGIA